MPLLNSEYLSNWYTLSFDGVGIVGTRICIAESFTQAKVQEASNKSAIQGDIGTHIMDIGGKYYTSSVSAPVLIGYTDADVFDVFDLIGHFTTYQSNTVPNNFFNNPDGNAYLLKSATIDISADAVKATANFEGDNRIDIATYVTNAPDNLYARTARFYDTKFTLGLIGTTPETFSFNILSGNININFDIDKVYILNSTQAPRFAIRGYSATGSIKLAITPELYATILDDPTVITGSEQTPGFLNTTFSGAELLIAPFVNGRKLVLGAYAVITKIEFNMQQNSIITANVEFAAYFNKSSTIVTNI
jgi:hypothetical protein